MTNRIQRMLVAAVAAAVLSTSAFAYDYLVGGVGQGEASDQSVADARAQQQATNGANSSCPGMAEEVEFTSDNCMNMGDDTNPNYICMVTAKAVCHIQTNRFGR